MKKFLLRSALIALTLIFAGCSIDDEDVQDTNGFVIDNVFHPTPIVYIDALDTHQNPDGSIVDAISITLATGDFLAANATIDPLDYTVLKLKISDLAVQPNIPLANYFVGVDAYSNAGVPMDAVTMLWQYSSNLNLTAVEKNVTINYVSASEIDLTYSFKRMDGKLITGTYNGHYITLVH
jgi:hypothetical protein